MKEGFTTQKFSSRGFGYRYAQELWAIFRRYNLFVSLDGDFFDSETKQKVRRNHIKCMIRNDYLAQENPELRGAVLDNILERFLSGVATAIKSYANDNPHEIQIRDTEESFLR